MSSFVNDEFELQKNKYILSIWKKVNEKNPSLQSSDSKPDVAVIVCLLKALGFHLEKFEKQEGSDADEVEPNNLKISLQCGSSKMQAVLKMNGVNCHCPDPEEQNGSFWSVTGTDVNKIEETGSTLLPHVSKEKNCILQSVTQCLFEMIEEKNDDENISTSSVCAGMLYNDKNNSNQRIIRSCTQPEISVTGRASLPPNYKTTMISTPTPMKTISSNSSTISSESTSDTSEKKVMRSRQNTYDIEIDSSEEEPRNLPPNISKSPAHSVSNLCGSLENISFQNDNVLQFVLSSLKNVVQVLDRHVNKPISSSQISINDEEVFQKPSMVFGDNTSKSGTSRAGSTSSLFSRSSTTLPKVAVKKPSMKDSRLTSGNHLKAPVQVKKPLSTSSRVSLQKTNLTDKTKKPYTTMSERTIVPPRKRMSDVGLSGSLIRNPISNTRSSKPFTSRLSLNTTTTLPKVNNKK